MTPSKIYIDGASCSLWQGDTPQFSNYTTACIGDFHADTLQGGKDLLEKAVIELKNSGCQYVIGPMNGNTWNSYRVASGGSHIPPFFMEPRNAAFYPEIFEQSGFDIIGRYCSGLVDLASVSDDVVMPEGIHIRTFNINSPEQELDIIYQLSRQAFAGNFLYTDVQRPDFMALYKPILPNINPDFILIAENENGEARGFLFAIPDYAQGSHPDRIIVKTYASLMKGVGRVMLDSIHMKAKHAGYCSAIHALMHDDNISRQRSAQYGQIFRQYFLYGRKIAP